MTALLGRKKELADVLRLFAGGAGRVAITGAPGVGKTRFAREAREELRRRGHDVELHDGSEPVLVAPGGSGEHVYALRGLAEAPAVELFRQRAGDDVADYATLAAGCRRLRGRPRAIERAATLLRTRSLEAALDDASRNLD